MITDTIVHGMKITYKYDDNKNHSPISTYTYNNKTYNLTWYYHRIREPLLVARPSQMLKSPILISYEYGDKMWAFIGNQCKNIIEVYARAIRYWKNLQKKIWPLYIFSPKEQTVHLFVYAITAKIMIYNEIQKRSEKDQKDIYDLCTKLEKY